MLIDNKYIFLKKLDIQKSIIVTSSPIHPMMRSKIFYSWARFIK